MRNKILPVLAAGALSAIVSLDPGIGFAGGTADPSQSERPDTILAGQVRQQGHLCDKVVEAHRDESLSRADEAVWVLTCTNATYRIRLHADMKARIELIDGAQ
jgi:hypothetical protein